VNIVGGTDLTLPKVNELMEAVAEQFGRDSHIVMGAVIDEALQGQVEVCILGTSDMGGRGGMIRRAPARGRALADAVQPASGGAPRAEAARSGEPAFPAGGEAKADDAPAAKTQQDEFGFGELESRGQFEKTDRNLFDGQDLDVPTYLRKGIKIVV
jgi:cell division protein FtsZ